MVWNIPHGPGNPRNSEGSFVKLRDGSILFVYTRYSGSSSHDNASADLYKMVSADGIHWSAPECLVRNTGQNVMSVSLLRLQDGRIALLYLRKSIYPGLSPEKFVDCRAWISFSADEGKTWTPEKDTVNLPACYHVVNNDRLIQLSGGRLLYPAAEHRFRPDRTDLHGTARFFFSDDGGESWRESAMSCIAPHWLESGFREPLTVELADGRVMAYFRTDGGCHWKAWSEDGGDHWSEPQMAPEFQAPDSPLSIKRDPVSGDLLACWNDHDPRRSVFFDQDSSWGRTPLVIARSQDEGKTWTGHQILEDAPDHGFCYIAMLFDRADLYLAYCCGGGAESMVLQDLRIRKLDAGSTAR